MAILSIGSLLSLSFLLPEREGYISKDTRSFRLLPFFAGTWFLSALGKMVSTLADLFDTSFSQVLNINTLRSFSTQTSLGRLQTLEVFVALTIFVFSFRIRKIGGTFLLLIAAFLGITAPVFESHASALGSHGLAIGSLVIHVVAIAFWLGAVSGFLFMDESQRLLARPRISVIALWSSIAIAASGVANSWTRLRLSESWLSIYGALIMLKIIAFCGVLVIAQRMRRSAPSTRLIRVELAILLLIMSIGSTLNRFVPIDNEFLPADRATQIIGVPMPAAPTLSRISLAYEADGLILGLLILLTALYIKGVLTLNRRGDYWPKGRTISFAIGIALLDFATNGGLGLYSRFSFEFHMISHMTLSMIVPIALVLSAPITLALRALPSGRVEGERGLKGLLIAILHSWPTRIWTNPIVALAIFDGSLFALYFTPLFGHLMSSHFGHLFMTAHFLLAGLLFFHVIVGIDPNPRKVHHLARVVLLFAAMSIHAFFSVSLMSAQDLVDGGYYQLLQRPWSLDLLNDQKVGAAIGWAMGEIPIVIALIATFIQWMRTDERDAKRADRRSESDLADYNEYLAQLAKRERNSKQV